VEALIDLYFFLSTLYENTNNHEQELYYLRRGLQIAKESGDSAAAGGTYYIMGRLYLTLNRLDSALLLEEKARVIGDAWNSKDAPWVLLTLGKIHLARGEQAKAVGYLRWSLARSRETQYLRGVVVTNLLLSDICKMQDKNDSSFYYAYVALAVSKQLNIPDLLLRSDTTLAGLYKSARRDDSTVKYQSLVIKLKDSIFNSNQGRQFQNIDFEEQQRRKEIENTRKTYRNQLRTLGLLAALVVFLSVAIFLWRNNRQRQKAFSLLQHQHQATDLQKAKLNGHLKISLLHKHS
jgi:tetratricopeptide (TPR) repeat protein